MESIIVRNDSDLSLTEAILYVMSVIRLGKISDDGKSYCYITKFDGGVIVAATKRKRSDSFRVWKEDL